MPSLGHEAQPSATIYADRVGHLTGPTGGLNGSTFLNGLTVRVDGSKDVLAGGSDQDWFIGHGVVKVLDKESNEVLTVV